MDKQLMYKYIFLLLIALFVIGIFLYNSFGSGDEEVDNVENLFPTEVEEEFDLEYYENEYNQLDDLELNEENISQSNNENENINREEEILEERFEDGMSDFEEKNVERYGKERVDQAKKITEEVMILWIEEETNIEKWEKVGTEELVEFVENELIVLDENVEREIDKLEINTVQSNNENEILFEVEATWYLKLNNELVDRQQRLYYVTILMKDNEELVHKIIEL